MSEQLTKQDIDFLQDASKDAPLEDVVAARELAAEVGGMSKTREVTVHNEDGSEEQIPVHNIGNTAAGTEVSIAPPNSLTDNWRTTDKQ